jgi:translocator assembly and maintenance protein 41
MGPLTSRETSLLLSDFPPVAHAFAYGSAVFAPEQYTPSEAAGAMTDLVFAVHDPFEWHRANLSLHPWHYSVVGRLGPGAVAALQERSGAHVYYNAMVCWRGRLIKYGVVKVDSLVDDLRNWTHLYLAGRMHKPTQLLVSEPEVEAAARANLRSAAAAALLLQPSGSCGEEELLCSICGLSYAGDPRRALVEASKSRDIAAAHAPALRAMYAEPLRELVGLGWGPVPDLAREAGWARQGVLPQGRVGRAATAEDAGENWAGWDPASSFFGAEGAPCSVTLRDLASLPSRRDQTSPRLDSACPQPQFGLSPSLNVREALLLALPGRAKTELSTELRPGLFRRHGLFRELGQGPNREASPKMNSGLGSRMFAEAPPGRQGAAGSGLARGGGDFYGGIGEAMLRHAAPKRAAAAAGAPVSAATEADAALLAQVRELYARSSDDGLAARAVGVALHSAVGRIVRRSSTSQTLKGALTGGALTTVRYVAAKIGKQMRR